MHQQASSVAFRVPKVSEAVRVCIPHLDSDHAGFREGQSNASASIMCRRCWIEIIAKFGKWSCYQYHGGGMIFSGVRGAVGGCAYGEVFRISEAVVLDFGPQLYPPRQYVRPRAMSTAIPEVRVGDFCICAALHLPSIPSCACIPRFCGRRALRTCSSSRGR